MIHGRNTFTKLFLDIGSVTVIEGGILVCSTFGFMSEIMHTEYYFSSQHIRAFYTSTFQYQPGALDFIDKKVADTQDKNGIISDILLKMVLFK